MDLKSSKNVWDIYRLGFLTTRLSSLLREHLQASGIQEFALSNVVLQPEHGSVLSDLFRNLPASTIRLESCPGVPSANLLAALTTRSSNLTNLSLVDMALMDGDLATLFSSLTMLEEINLANNNKLTNAVFLDIIKTYPPQLKKINLTSIPISDQAVIKIVTECPQLKALKLNKTGVTNSLQKIFQITPTLEELYLSGKKKKSSYFCP